MKATKAQRDWDAERDSFLQQIDPNNHFHRAFDGLPDVYFFVKNRRGETLFCSRNLLANHGMTDESEMVGKTDQDLTPGPLAQKYLADDAIIYETGQPLPPRVELCLDQVGLPDWYRTSKFPIKDRQGNVIGIMGTFQRASVRMSPDEQASGLEAARAMLATHLERFPTLELLAKCSAMNERTFQRVFRQVYGQSPQNYWMKLRIRAACEWIREGRMTLLQISTRLGFYDQSNFTKQFRKHTGRTPKQYAQFNRFTTR